jgi:hypothetical protein
LTPQPNAMTTTDKLRSGIYATAEGRDVAERIIHYAGYNVPNGERCLRTITTTDTALGEICRALGVSHEAPDQITPAYRTFIRIADNYAIQVEGAVRVMEVRWSESEA